MKKIDVGVLKTITENAGIDTTSASNIIGTLEVSLNRQAARDPERKIVLDENSFPQIQDALSIGAGITQTQANDILRNMKQTLVRQNDLEIKLFDESTFLLEGDELVFKLNKKD